MKTVMKRNDEFVNEHVKTVMPFHTNSEKFVLFFH